ncbi:DNA repair protein RecN [bacterium]|nr:DNA repair protein RecN [bacterium]
MLTRLIIKNFALIKHTEIAFYNGFHVITGETGAGKSIIINAAKLLLGGRATPEMIRMGENEASVEGVFEIKSKLVIPILKEIGIDFDEDDPILIIKRVISVSRKNRVYINGSMFQLKQLSDVSTHLLNISSQHEYQYLLDPETHIAALDEYVGDDSILNNYQTIYFKFIKNRDLIRKLKAQKEELEEKKEFYAFMKREIDAVNPKRGELEKIEAELNVLEHADELKVVFKEVIKELYNSGNSVYAQLNHSIQKLTQHKEYLKNGENEIDALQEAYYIIENVTSDLRSEAEAIDEIDFDKLDELRYRHHELMKLYKKYGGNESRFFERFDSIVESLDTIDKIDEELVGLEKSVEKEELQLIEEGIKLNKIRVQKALELNELITSNLRKMAMPHSSFLIQIEHKAEKSSITEFGLDVVEFLIKTHEEGVFRPIKNIASGGELSRILLAIKETLSSKDEMKTYIFDEVDQGIGGETAHYIGELLTKVSKRAQIFVITHLVQVASRANHHYCVSKAYNGSETISTITYLSKQDREKELARMIGDPTQDASIQFVRKLLQEVNNG